jgi:hypothetical protein
MPQTPQSVERFPHRQRGEQGALTGLRDTVPAVGQQVMVAIRGPAMLGSASRPHATDSRMEAEGVHGFDHRRREIRIAMIMADAVAVEVLHVSGCQCVVSS